MHIFYCINAYFLANHQEVTEPSQDMELSQLLPHRGDMELLLLNLVMEEPHPRVVMEVPPSNPQHKLMEGMAKLVRLQWGVRAMCQVLPSIRYK